MKESIHTLVLLCILFAVSGCSDKARVVPVLLLARDSDFGTYTAEILKTEGFNEFVLDSFAGNNIKKSYLAGFRLIILAESGINQQGIQQVREYVKNGGNLIAFHPDPRLAELFGIKPSTGKFTGGYLCIDTTAEQGKGLIGKELQVHSTGDVYTLNGGKVIAYFKASGKSITQYPAAVKYNYKKGHTIAFLYNLPENIVYTRQGNPLFAGFEKDSIPGIRGMDLFTDGWVDTSNNTINQADQQMALLSHCIEQMDNHMILPRFWYFPDTLKCLVTLTNDGEYKSETDFEPQFREVDSMGAKMSIYIIGVDKVSKQWVEKWTSKGFEISGHPDDTREAGNPVWNHMDSALRTRVNEIAGKYGLPMRTNVNHWFVWCGNNADGTQDFAAQARLEEINGIEMDINYAHYDMKSNQGEHYLGTPGTKQGNFTGSGHVMRFAGSKGKIINVFQHFNAVYDQEYNESNDAEGFYNCFKGLMDRSLYNEIYSFISIKSHNDEYYFSRIPLMRMLAYAGNNGIPVWTELRLLDFLKMKDEAKFSGLRWKNNRLSFLLSTSLKDPAGLTFMLPAIHGDLKIAEIVVNDHERKFVQRTVKGKKYALVVVDPDSSYKISANYR